MNLKIIRGIGIGFMILLFSPSLFAQSSKEVPNYMKMPRKLADNVKAEFINAIHSGEKSLLKVANGPKASNVWTVYSDRSDNILRGSPNGLKKRGDRKALRFMEQVIVKEIKQKDGHFWFNVYSRIYQAHEGADVQHHKERGWIRADKVLLTNYALLNEKSITKKEMALFSIDVGKDPEEVDYLYYEKPAAKESKGVVQKFDIYYVLKEEVGNLLLSNTDKLSGEKVKGDVLGWMKNAKTTSWDHRVCLERTHGKRIKSKYSSRKEYKEYKLPVFDNIEALKFFLSNNQAKQKTIFRSLNIEKDRPHPQSMRMPVLENIDNEKKKVVTIVDVGEEERTNKAKIQERLNKLKNKREAVNILFVIDGTESMTEYYPPIRESIIETIKNNPVSATEKKLRFGLAIYRDYPDGKEKFSLIPLTNDHEKIIKELHKVETKSKDDDLPEAQYQGIINGLKKAGFEKGNSNVVVLVGDAGNHKPDPKDHTYQKVIDHLYKKRASLITFQVVNGTHTTYDAFNYDVQEYLRNSANRYVKNASDVKLTKANVENTYKLAYPNFSRKDESLFMFGRFTYASSDQKAMGPSLLNKNIVTALQDYLNTVDEAITMIQNARRGGQTKDGKPDEQFLRWLRLQDWSEELIRTYQRMGHITKKGFVNTHYYGLDKPCFKPVVFLSETEKRDIDNTLRALIEGRMTKTERQKEMQNTLLNQCLKMLGSDSKDQILNKTMDEIWDIILNVPFTGRKSIKDKKLREISTMNKKEFQKFYHDFKEAARRFMNKSYRDSKFELADQYFYWIPLKDLPGNDS